MARSLRQRATDAEAKLWGRLRNRQLDGLKFKRQATIGRFVADFLCAEHHLIVELDGGQHGLDANIVRDADRTEQLEAMGYTVVRFWNIDVLQNIQGVLDAILDQLNRLEPIRADRPEPPHPVPLPSGERGPTGSALPEPDTPKRTSPSDSSATTPSPRRPGGERDRVRGDRPIPRDNPHA